MKLFKSDKLIAVILFIFSLWQLSSLLQPYWPSSHDGIFHYIRIREYFIELKAGQFPVRWVQNLDNGYGLPVFNYVYPLPYILAVIPQLINISVANSYKIVMFLGYYLGVLGFYFLLKSKNKFFGIVSAMIFGLTPYLFLNIFVRGAIGEILAIGFMPWILYAFSKKKFILSSLTLSFILISHNFLGLLFLVFLIVYLIWIKQFSKNTIFSIIISIGISSFFLIPMLFENKLVQSGAYHDYTFDYREQFLYPFQLIYSKWDYWYSNPGPNDGMSFQLGFANIIIIVVSLITIFIIKNKSKLIFLTLSIIFSIFLTLIYSQLIWNYIPPLQVAQFPWRFLFMVCLISPLLYFEIVNNLYHRYPNLVKVISVCIILLALFNTRNYRRPMKFQNNDEFQILLNTYNYKTTTAARGEVAPIWSPIEKYSATTKFSFEIVKESNLILNINYFPGFSLINENTNQKVLILPNKDGNIISSLTSAKYKLKYTGTKLENYSNIISLSSIVLLLLISIRLKLYKLYGN
jgi:hypothetical protein